MACVTVGLATMFFCQNSFAQSDKSRQLQSFLEKIDANGNGSIEPDEMSGNTKAFLSKLGVDSGKAVKISKVISKSKKANGKSSEAEKPTPKRAQNELKVPGFGAEKKSATVRSFSAANSISKAGKTYSKNILEQTQRTLERYDRNEDGVLDESELNRVRWGSPRPSNSDLNGDGRLSKYELNERYLAREKSSSGDSGREDRDDRSDKRSDRDRSSSIRDRDRERDSERDSRLIRTSHSGPSSEKPTTSDRLKYQKYAQSQMNSYDRNKDGKLDEGEMEKMKRLPKGADTNKDGFVSHVELANSLRNADQSKTSSSSAKRSYSKNNRSSARTTTSSNSRSKNSSLGKLDANGDDQIQMHEFSDKWDEEVVAEYYEADKNGDGVITAAEWSDR